MRDLKVKRQQLLSFLLRHGRSFPGGKNLIFQDQIEAISAAQVRLATLEQQLREYLSDRFGNIGAHQPVAIAMVDTDLLQTIEIAQQRFPFRRNGGLT